MSVREKRVSSEGKLGEPSECSIGLTLVKVRGKGGRLHRRVLDCPRVLRKSLSQSPIRGVPHLLRMNPPQYPAMFNYWIGATPRIAWPP